MNLVIDAVVDVNLFQSVKDNVRKSMVIDANNGGLAGFVESVLDAVGAGDAGSQEIGVLRLWSHGYVNENSDKENGNIIFGSNKLDNLRADNFGHYQGQLDRLSPHFASKARAELRGCIAAKGTGAKLMINLANLWKVDVFGSDKYQSQILSWPSKVFVARPSASEIAETIGPNVN